MGPQKRVKILIGAPVYQRAWIMEDWFSCIENQSVPLSDIGFVFELGPGDEKTHEVIWDWQSRHPEVSLFDARVSELPNQRTHVEGQRRWKPDEYHRMVALRNSLLARVINYKPERYFSLDSDILLENPNTLQRLYDHGDKCDAVSPLCYMTPFDRNFPNLMSWASLRKDRAVRIIGDYPKMSMFKADVIMAAVMMNEKAYTAARYKYHRQGEDIGWSQDADQNDVSRYHDSSIYAPHIMHREMLKNYKEKGDPRSTNLELLSL